MKGIIGAMLGCALSLAFAATPASATPRKYEFSGRLTDASLFNGSTNADWHFAAGAAFSGTITYDPAAIASSYDYIDSPDWKLTFHRSPVVGFDYRIATSSGDFSYAPPIAGGYAAIGAAKTQGGGWTGADFRFQNYPLNGTPQYDVPSTGYVGSYYAHASFLSLLDYNARPLTNTDPDIDLAALAAALPPSSKTFSVRFSDPSRWNETPGVERIDGILMGQIDRFSLVSGGVPEPTTWAMMIVGFGAVGGALRRRPARRTLRIA